MRGLFVGLLALLLSFCWADEVVQTFDAPDTEISGLTWGDGSLWAVSTETNTLFELDPNGGAVLNSFSVSVAGGHEITGLAFYNGILYVGENYPGSTNSGYIYKYTTTGVFQGSTDVVC